MPHGHVAGNAGLVVEVRKHTVDFVGVLLMLLLVLPGEKSQENQQEW